MTGVGMVATAAWTSRALATERYDLALNIGVCGSFTPRFKPADVVHVVSDRLSELGAEDDTTFLTVHELRLLGEDDFPLRGGAMVNTSPPGNPALSRLPTANGITVNTVHGSVKSIEEAVARFHPDVETMEGAAFMYACLIQQVPFAQVRAVSNVVEKRNRSAWRITDAIASLTRAAADIIDHA
jgi:futalosine hydrolase